jgi:hypothetical protein
VHEVEPLLQGRRRGSGKKLLDRPRRLFEFRLALALRRSHAELLATVDAAELAEWEAFWSIEPWGDEWRQTARLATALCSAWGCKDLKEEMLMPSHRKRQQTPAEMFAELSKLAQATQAAREARGG